MANRSYLYSIDKKPKLIGKTTGGGIAEYAYDVPTVFKILCSVKPTITKSLIWGFNKKIAITADYLGGVKRLEAYFRQIEGYVEQDVIDSALNFLKDSANQRKYFHLECGELYDMNDEGLGRQNRRLLKQIKKLDAEIAESVRKIQAGDEEEKETLLIDWTDILYYEL